MKHFFTLILAITIVTNSFAQKVSDNGLTASKTKPDYELINALYKNEGLYSSFKPEDEVVELRSANAKHFRNIDGTIAAVIGAGDLHYMENGEWKEILSHVFPNQTQQHINYSFASVHNQHKMYFPAKPGLPVITEKVNGTYEDWSQPAMVWLDENGNTISEILPNALANCRVSKDSLVYADMFPSVDAIIINSLRTKKLNYLLNDQSILTNKPSQAVYLAFRETIRTGNQWKISGNESYEKGFSFLTEGKLMRDILFKNAAGQSEIEIQAPLYYEYKGFAGNPGIWNPDPTAYYNGSYLIKEKEDGYESFTLVPVSWLTDGNRTFPLMIDPVTNYYPGGTWPTYAVYRSGNSGNWVCNTGAYGNRTYPNSDISYGWIDDTWPTNNPYLDGYATFNITAIPDDACINSVDYNWYRYGGRGCGTDITLKFGRVQNNDNLAEEPSCDITGIRIRNNNAYYNGTGKNATGWQNQPSTATTVSNLVAALAGNTITAGWAYNGGDDCCTSFLGINCTGDDGNWHNVYGYEHTTRKPYVTVDYYTTSTAASSASVNINPSCPGQSVTLSVNGGSLGSGADWYWYSGSCGGTAVGTGSSISVNPSTTTTYYVRAQGYCNTTGCVSVTVNVTNTLSVAPTGAAGTTTICSGQSTTLTVAGGTQGTGVVTQWFTGSCGGTSVGTNNSITVSPTTTTTYYVRYSGTCNTTTCASVTVTVNTLSVAPTGASGTTTICSGQSTTLTVAGGTQGTGAVTQWFTGSCGGTSVGTNNSITVSPTSTTTYYVRYSGTCNTTTCATVTVTVNSLSVAPTGISGTTTICSGGSTTLSVVGGSLGNGASWQWFSGSCGGTGAGSGVSSITVSPGSTTTYFVRASGTCNTTVCQSQTVTVNPLPNGNITGTTSICQGQSATITFNFTAGTGPYNIVYSDGSSNFTLNGINSGQTASVTPTNTITNYSFVSITDANGCQRTSGFGGSATIILNPSPVVTFSVLGPYCVNATAVSLTTFGNPSGGLFSGPGVTGAQGSQTFVPSSAGVGTHTLTYTYTDGNNCSNSATRNVTVNALPTVTFSSPGGPYCISQTTPVSLSASPAGGLFSGNGVNGNTFIPSNALVGSNTLTYTYTDINGCTNSAQQTVVVNPLPTVSFSGLAGPYCVSQTTPVFLTGSQSGGTFSGPGITDLGGGTANFTPSVAGSGTHSIVFTYTDGNTCINSTTQSVQVIDLPAVSIGNLAASYCINNPPVQLIGFPAGGSFSVTPALTSGGLFTPSTGLGTYTITYTYTNGNGCTNSVSETTIVNDLPVVSFTGFTLPQYCINGANVTLTGNPAGGTFSGQGVSTSGVFTPSNAGLGTHTITYTYSDGNNCSNTSSQTVTVVSSPIVSFTGLVGDYCVNDATVTLTGNQSGGTFTGPGITNLGNGTAQFSPTAAGIGGAYPIVFTYTDANGCSGTETQYTVVHPQPVVAFSGLSAAYCVDATPVTLTGSHNPGGTFSGTGITDNGNGTAIFDPAAAGVGGLYAITYSYSDVFGCSNSISQNTMVNDTPNVSFTGLYDVCIDQPALTLIGTPPGGVFSGTGVSGNLFYPNLSGLGVHTVTYSYTDPNGCDGEYADSLRVYDIPQITQQPQDVQVCPGDAASFTVGALGLGLTYQWMVNDGNGFVVVNNVGIYSGATSNTLSISAVPPSLDGYQFQCVVTGATCLTTTTSTTVTITENPSPTINTQPADYATCVGDNAVFSVTASGTSLTYQWQVNTGGGFVNITNGGVYSGATTNTLTITGFTAGMDGYQYQCVVTGTINCTYSSTSNAAILSLTTSPNITQQPVTQSICEGDNAVFTTTATGTGLTYQWQENTGSGFVNVVNGGDYSGATSATLTVAGVTNGMNGYQYHCIISGSICVNSSTTNTVLINITTSPAIIQQPVDAYVCPTDPASFSITTQGTGITYQWQVNNGGGFINIFNGGIYSGATSATLNISAVQNNMDGYQYRCLVNGIFCSGTSTSLVGTVYVNGAPVITQHPTDMNYCVGDNATFTVSASGTGLTYQWQVNDGSGWVNLVNGINYNGTNSASLNIIAAPLSFDGNLYRVIVSGSINCSGSTTSNAAVFNEDPNPFISSQPVDQYACTGDNAVFQVTASGSGLTYQWQENTGSGFVNITNGGVYSGATTNTLTITGVNPGMDGYTYQCVINGTICTGTSITNIVTLHSTTSPYISVQPQDQAVCIGDNVIMSVTANGTGLTYQWQENTGSGFVNIANAGVYSGATSSTLIISGATVGMNNYQYQVIINGTSCPNPSTSNAVTLFVGQSPMILTDPVAQAICAGFDASFSITTLGNNLTYQWQVNTGSGFTDVVNGGVYSGATTTTLDITGATVGMNGYQYQCVVTGSINCALTSTSLAAVLTVNAAPVVSFTGLNSQYCVDAPVVTLTGSPAGGTFSGPGISGNTFLASTAGVGGPYTILYEYTDGNGCYGSTTQTVSVNDLPVVSFSGLAGPYCINDNTPVVLSGSPSGGNFSGTGVTGNTFISSIAQVGNNSVTYTYTNLNGCVSSETQVAVVNALPVVSFTGLNGPYCEDYSSPISLTGNNSGGTFTASGAGLTDNGNGTASFDASVAGAGTHTIIYTYTDGNGCAGSETQTVLVNQLPAVTFSGLASQYCVTNPAVTLTGFPSGGTFSGNGISSNTFDPAVAGLGSHTITYQYTNPNTGCSNTVTQSTTVYDQPVANAGQGGDVCGSSFTLGATPSVGNGTWTAVGPGTATYAPSASDPAATATVSAFGTYTFTWTEDNNGCSSSAAVTVNFYDQPVVSAGAGGSECDLDFTFTGTSSAGVGSWSASGPGIAFYTNNSDPAASVMVSTSGSYTFTFTATNGTCTASDQVTVDFNVLPVSNAGQDGSECDLDFVLNAVPTVGTGTWTQVSGPGTSAFSPSANDPAATVVVTAPGTYVYDWTEDHNGCTSSDQVQVVFHQAPLVTTTPSGNAAICQGGNILLSANSGFATYLWSNGNQNQSFLADQAGQYTVTVTDIYGCTGTSAPVDITVNTLPVVDLGNDTTVCNGGTVTLNAGNFASYLWSPGGETTSTLTVTATGGYSVTVTDVNGCTGSDQVSVTAGQLQTPVVTSSGPTTFCYGDSLTMTVPTGYATYQWSDGLTTTNSLTVYDAGLYSVYVTDNAGCSGSSAPVVVTVLQAPSPAIAASGPVAFCPGEDVTLSAGFGYSSYLWSPGNQNTESITVNQAGQYSVTVTGANGCSSTTADVTVTVFSVQNPAIQADGPLQFCYGDSVHLSVNGAWASYLWTSGSTTPFITVTETGQYGVTVLDMNGCLDSSLVVNPVTVTVWQPQPFIVESGDTLTCTPVFQSYQWYLNGNSIAGANSQVYITQESGNYSVVVTDNHNCTGTSNIVEHSQTGIEDHELNADISIYPNPTHGVFTFNAVFDRHENVRLELTNALGQLIIPVEDVKDVMNIKRDYNLNHLPDGVYILLIRTDKGQIAKRIVKS